MIDLNLTLQSKLFHRAVTKSASRLATIPVIIDLACAGLLLPGEDFCFFGAVLPPLFFLSAPPDEPFDEPPDDDGCLPFSSYIFTYLPPTFVHSPNLTLKSAFCFDFFARSLQSESLYFL